MADSEDERSCLFEYIILAEETNRYSDMRQLVKEVINVAGNTELTDEERSAFSSAYKNSLGSLRSSWEVLDFATKRLKSQIKARKESDGNDLTLERKLEITESYLKDITKELSDLCNEVVMLLDNHLIDNTNQDQIKVVYLKMKGDYFRYQVQITSGEERDRLSEKSYQAYLAANELARERLDAIDPVRLGLALNYSVFHYEVRKDPEQACLYAKQAFGDAIENLDKIAKNNKKYKESTHIMQLLRDNQALWSKEIREGSEIKV